MREIKTIVYLFLLLLSSYLAFNWSECIQNLKWYNCIGKTVEIIALFATIGGFYLSYKAIYKVVEIEEAMFQKEVNKGFIKAYKEWLKQGQINGFHTKLYDDLTITVKQHMDHVGRFKRRRLQKELRNLTKHKKKAEKQNSDISKVFENSLNCFINISKIYNNGE